MKYQVGYLAITHPNWVAVCTSHKLYSVNLWQRKIKFKVISPGELIFFVERGSRIIRGYGVFEKFEVNATCNSWKKYNIGNGALNYRDFLNTLNFPYNEAGFKREIGSIIVKDVKWLKELLRVSDLKIDFPKSVVSGKRIFNEDVELILDKIK